ncbi:MAG: contractile injection system tape measure protein, partial [Pseudomonadota bacterium]
RGSGLGLDPTRMTRIISETLDDLIKSKRENPAEILTSLAARLGLEASDLKDRLARAALDLAQPIPQALETFLPKPLVPQSRPLRDTPVRMHTGMAGLVLLHHFLPSYLDRAGCLTDGRFETPEQIYRAIHLIGLLAAGRANCPEHELTLAKILVGLPPDAPVGPGFDASDEDRSLANDLLRHVASEVPGLTNTTPDVLRDTFLMRHGEIFSATPENPMRLVVTRGPFDMLLGNVPWPFSTICCPWMNEALHVTWI